MSWLLREVPPGCRVISLANECAALGLARLAEAARVLGEFGAKEAAIRAGRYELGDEEARTLGLAGALLDDGGELPALSPARWTELTPGDPLDGEVVGLLLTEREAQDFERFLTRNQGKELDPERAVTLARHFFYGAPVRVVVRTGTGT